MCEEGKELVVSDDGGCDNDDEATTGCLRCKKDPDGAQCLLTVVIFWKPCARPCVEGWTFITHLIFTIILF